MRVAFIGLGNMGGGMALRLVGAGHELLVYNRTRSKAAPLVRAGARVCESPAAACDAVDAVVTMTADDRSSREVWLGADGVLAAAGLRSGTLAIECSTLSQHWVLDLATAAREHGVRFLDAPVTGLPASAAAGTLTVLAGAAAADLERAHPLLCAFAERILHFGEVGTGTAYKLIVNLIGAVQIASLAEGLALAERAGLDLPAVTEALATGQAASPQVVRNARRIADGDHDRNVVFTPVLRLKDVDYALQLAAGLGLRAPFGQLAEAQLQQLVSAGSGARNESCIIDVARLQVLPAPAVGD